VMAILCLAENLQDLQERLGHIVIGVNLDKKPVTAKDLKANGAMAAILRSAVLPNLVQTTEGNPVLVHGGPFANIAHGCNSLISTQAGLSLADYVVTEAGFGADLGAEKFLDIKCRKAGIWPSCAVLVATVRGLLHHGKSLDGTLESGMINIRRHVENLKKFGLPVVVAINRFTHDTDTDLNFVIEHCKEKFGVNCVINNSWAEGSKGSEQLGHAVVELCNKSEAKQKLLYEDKVPLFDKVRVIAQQLYGARDIDADTAVKQKLAEFENFGFGHLPICIAKTQYSFSTDPLKLGAATDHIVKVREVRLAAGAGFVVAVCGDLMTMPGLPRRPSAENIFVNADGQIEGLF
jgi:formate--tetrahydrofolate ligase